jgi:hypothetical protein
MMVGVPGLWRCGGKRACELAATSANGELYFTEVNSEPFELTPSS